MPPTKPYSADKVGEAAQHNYKFFEDCFDPGNGPFRDWFFAASTGEEDVRAKLKDYKLVVPGSVKLVVVDLENARMRNWSLNPKTQDFYEFIMPPVPRRSEDDDYVEGQLWEEAWFHAMVDGYGM
jgi:hypothetical protein